MRIIKFRAWDGDNWVYSSSIKYDERSRNWMIYDLSKSDWVYCSIPKQYTGVDDRYGIEIYEDDIVKGKYWDYGKERRFIGQIQFLETAFKIVGVKQYKGMRQELNRFYEIIGNIYESPELKEEN